MQWSVTNGDCLELLRELPADSVDSCVTDPPYELGFMGKKWDASGIAYSVELWREVMRVLKPGGHLLAFGGTRTHHRMVCAIEDAGFEIRDEMQWIYGSGFPKSLDVSKAIDKAAGAEREVVGFQRITGGAARKWQGWGTALKPANEPICVARKPLIGTVAENVLEYGTGAINVDAGRVESDVPVQSSAGKGAPFGPGAYPIGEGRQYQNQGRWPANVLHDGSEEVRAAFAMFGESKSVSSMRGVGLTASDSKVYGKGDPDFDTMRGHNDTGTAARFFKSCPWSEADLRFIYCAKAPSSQRLNVGGVSHPTQKPLALMQYLVRLVTPQGGTVLDPFTGSGTTGAAALESGCAFIGFELNHEYCEIARRRIEAAVPLFAEATNA